MERQAGQERKPLRPEPERISDNVVQLRPDDRAYVAFETREHPPRIAHPLRHPALALSGL